MTTPRKITVKGITLTVTEWSAKTGIPAQTIFKRLDNGWPADKAVSKPNHVHTRLPALNRAEYAAWKDIRRRCNNKKRKDYARYGGRGIKVCARWNSFAAFLADMGRRPSKDHSIERRNNDRGYQPDNCFWATRQQQARNKRSSSNLTHDGITLCIADWADRTGIPASNIWNRVYAHGWPIARALTEPVGRPGTYARTPR